MTSPDLSVFLVDDDASVCKAWGHVLLARGYAVMTFDSGEAFLASPRSSQPGCVLLDFAMKPGMNGLQVFDELRRRGSPLVVVFLSGEGTIPDSVRAMKGGAADWIQKPCSEEQLLDAVARALDSAQAIARRRAVKAGRMALWQSLTPREAEVAGHVRLGKKNKAIGDEMGIDGRTVEAHRASGYAKLQVNSSNELDRFMRDMDL